MEKYVDMKFQKKNVIHVQKNVIITGENRVVKTERKKEK